MARHLMLAFTNAVEGREAELRQWYRERHIPDLLVVPGIASATIYDVKLLKAPNGLTYENLAVYEIEADDALAVIAESGRRMGTDAMPRSPALADDTLAIFASVREGTGA